MKILAEVFRMSDGRRIAVQTNAPAVDVLQDSDVLSYWDELHSWIQSDSTRPLRVDISGERYVRYTKLADDAEV